MHLWCYYLNSEFTNRIPDRKSNIWKQGLDQTYWQIRAVQKKRHPLTQDNCLHFCVPWSTFLIRLVDNPRRYHETYAVQTGNACQEHSNSDWKYMQRTQQYRLDMYAENKAVQTGNFRTEHSNANWKYPQRTQQYRLEMPAENKVVQTGKSCTEHSSIDWKCLQRT